MMQFLRLFIVLVSLWITSAQQIIKKVIQDDVDLSQFYSLIERSQAANFTLTVKSVTIFAPSNGAFQKFDGKSDEDDVVLYHMTDIAVPIDGLALETYLPSEASGHPLLWITHKKGIYNDDIYINNARLYASSSNIKGKNDNGKEQILHKIDEVLVPLVQMKNANTKVHNPTAWDFISNFESFNINSALSHRVRTFRERIEKLKKQDVFKANGAYTFFIPVDEGFKNDEGVVLVSKAEHVDAKVIDGHVIPNNALFTAPTDKNFPFDTLAEVDNLKVHISFVQESDDNAVSVKSHTIIGDKDHKDGVVLAEIVKANIPVRNGVVHLIHKPLMVVDHTVKQFLEERDDGPLKEFLRQIKDAGEIGEAFMRKINRSGDITLFAPTNSAWEDGNLQSILQDKRKMKELLDMHLVVDRRLPKAQIISNINKHDYQAVTADTRKTLYFNVVTVGNNQTLTVEGGGVNATVIQEDIAATNGIIHIIDRVLGVPYSTVLDKLKTDPLLNMTYYLGQRSGLNNQLNDTTKKFTYFVPRDKAWNDARVELPSAIKKLFMDDFKYHAQQILERHIVVSDQTYTLEKIKNMSDDSAYYGGQPNEVTLSTLRDSLQIFVEERQDHTFIIHWKGQRIPVFRPNVECTNGIIHVIDVPFLKEGDIRVSSANTLTAFAPHILMILAARWFLP